MRRKHNQFVLSRCVRMLTALPTLVNSSSSRFPSGHSADSRLNSVKLISIAFYCSPPHVTFKNGAMRQKWIAAISTHQEIKFSDQFQVCGRHFNPGDINKTIGLLKLNAVPVHFPIIVIEQRPVNEEHKVNEPKM